jgi:arsenate reductase (glutaredoxin)
MNIQILGTKKCKETQKAIRFFKERRIPHHFRDLRVKPISPGELEKTSRSVPVEELIDENSASYKKRGFTYMEYDPLEEILADNGLLRTPIVRNGDQATAGSDTDAWTEWIREEK